MSDKITFGSKKIPYFENEMDYVKTPNYTIENLCETEKYLLKQKTIEDLEKMIWYAKRRIEKEKNELKTKGRSH